MINPTMMNKEDVERLCKKSLKISGKKWLWRKTAEKHGLTWQEVEEQIDIKIKRDQEHLNRIEELYAKQQSDKQLGTTGELDNTPVRIGRVASLPDGVERGEPIVTVGGKEVRPGETENGSSTPKGSQ